MNRTIDFPRFLRIALILSIAGIAIASEKSCQDPAIETTPACRAAADCNGLPHVDCAGSWDCASGGCLWRCSADGGNVPDSGPGVPVEDAGPSPELQCVSDSDCEVGYLCDAETGTCAPASEPPTCMASGCSGEICATEPMASACIWLEWFACLKLTVCEAQPDGTCGFTPNEAFLACMSGQPCHADLACPPGTICSDGVCVDAPCIPSEEVCDGIDNNCDGIVDEGCFDPQCKAVKPGTHGACKMLLGFFFDGRQCYQEGGCDCAPDCDAMFDTMEACQAACEPLACTTAADCPSGVCLNGVCALGPACAVDSDCAMFETCSDGLCVLTPGRCWSDADCGEDLRCEGARICPPGALCLLADEPGRCVEAAKECKSDKDCPAGAYCMWTCDGAAGGCTATCQPLAEGVCVKDADCKDGQTCVTGYCPLCVGCPCFGVCQDTGTPKCTAVKPGSHGMCMMVLGWIFDGKRCVLESGCSCGADCAEFFADEDACRKACL